MHESSLGRQVLRVVLAKAREAGAGRVRAVRGWIAEDEYLDANAIAFHFEAHARGTPAEGARLELELRRLDARCRACAAVYQPEHHVTVCPSCGHGEADILGEVGLAVDSMDIEGQAADIPEGA